jgi:site-specific recombinase XerC
MTTSTLILPVSGEEDLASWAAIAFVASYSSPGTRQAYATQLRLWFDWCEQHHLEPQPDVRRPHVELYARDLEARGLAPATVAFKLVVLTGFYRYGVEEQLLEQLSGRPRTPAQDLPGVHPARTRPVRARRVPRPGRAVRRQRPRPGLSARTTDGTRSRHRGW